jgi:hypothetical protein
MLGAGFINYLFDSMHRNDLKSKKIRRATMEAAGKHLKKSYLWTIKDIHSVPRLAAPTMKESPKQIMRR